MMQLVLNKMFVYQKTSITIGLMIGAFLVTMFLLGYGAVILKIVGIVLLLGFVLYCIVMIALMALYAIYKIFHLLLGLIAIFVAIVLIATTINWIF